MLASFWLLIAIPLASAAILLLVGRRGDRWGPLLGAGSVGVSFVLALVYFFALRGVDPRAVQLNLFRFVPVGGLRIDFGLLFDPLSAVFVLLITGVGFLIHVYAIGYMAHDEGRRRFFGYFNLFVAAMLLLVLGNNYVMLYLGWEGVGLASYLLIAFWFLRPSAATAGKKAFLMNRVGDAGFVIAIFLMFATLGSVNFADVFNNVGRLPTGVVTAMGLLLLLGACGKSGQFPLQTWLPDAMEGPTPVSALIHAATMVTAGVYLIARTHPLFVLAPTAADISAFIGLAKRIIAYSTISQIGYMVVGVSIGAYAAGLFHLMTHAFFKALLFMAAGSVISAMAGTQDIDRMGGLRRVLPFTSTLMIVGALALAAFPGTSGFFSKDEILVFAAQRGGFYWIFTIGGYFAALLTAVYAFRIVFRVFWGEPVEEARELDQGHLAHAEPENPM